MELIHLPSSAGSDEVRSLLPVGPMRRGRAGFVQLVLLEDVPRQETREKMVAARRTQRRLQRDRILRKALDLLSDTEALAGVRVMASGKPAIPGSEWHFSTSYSQGYVALLVSGDECGIDIEIEIDDLSLADVASVIFDATIFSAWQAAGSPGHLVYESWTRREAVGKAAGTGIVDDILGGVLSQPAALRGSSFHHTHILLQDRMHLAVAARREFKQLLVLQEQGQDIAA